MQQSRRHSILSFWAIFLFALLSANFIYAQVLSGQPEKWIVPLPFDRAASQAPPAPGESIRWLLRDRQINELVDQSYGHNTLQILTSAGVQEASEISVDFDPSCETLTFHSVKILRDGALLERFDPAKVRVIQREAELENHLFSGIQTAVLVVDDLRHGDILDYSFTITGTNPSLRGHWFGRVPVQLESPVARLRTRLLWPAQHQLYTKNYLTDVRPIAARKGDLIEFLWDLKNVPALRVEDSLPVWYDPLPSVQLSEYHQWSEVNQWALGLFTNAAPLSPALVKQINDWRRFKDHNAATLSALQFVQDDVRYLGIESGPNAYTPAPPDTVFERRYGDCKDKTFLLVTILRGLGVPAFPVLVSTTSRRTVAEQQPTSTAFDHAIVQANVDGAIYYLDPTATFQRGPLAARYNPNYGYGLVVRPGTTALTPIPPSGGQPLTTVNEYFHIDLPPGSATVKIVTVAEGEDAVVLRERYATTPRDQIDRQDLDYLAKFYPQIIQTDPTVFIDNDALNRVEVDQFYRVDGNWTPPPTTAGIWWDFRIYSHNVEQALRRAGSFNRVMPLGVRYPRHEIFHMQTDPPPLGQYTGDQDLAVRNPAFYFHRLVNTSGPTLYVNLEYQSLADFVPASGVSEFSRQIAQASDLLGYTLESYPMKQ